MKLSEIKVGYKIQHYVFGFLVDAVVIKTNGTTIKTKHDPIKWGKDEIDECIIMESSELQKQYGGKDKNGRHAKGPDTTPAAFFNGKPITI